jgi:hypothetical protein
MNNKDFAALVGEFRKKQDELIILKGNDYTVGNAQEDRLWNFKTVAGLLGITPLQCLGVYWLKHVLAICTFIKYGKVESEDIDGRFLDESNYNLLGRALVKEGHKGDSNEVELPGKLIRQAMPVLRKTKARTKDKRFNNSKRRKVSSRGRSVR